MYYVTSSSICYKHEGAENSRFYRFVEELAALITNQTDRHTNARNK